MTTLLQMRGIAKTYGAVRANDGIDLDLGAGEILGLLGENGSGKSTLMKILAGLVPPDGGGILLDGRELSGHTPRDAAALGIGMIHQHFSLVEAMSVTETVALGWDAAPGFLRLRSIAARVRRASDEYGLGIDPAARVAALSLGQRQRVEILKAVIRGVRLLVLDEPTSNLAPPEIASLLAVLRRLRAQGCGIVFISHKLAEVRALCDRIVVLRDGRVAGTCGPDADEDRLAMMMVGREVGSALPRGDAPAGRTLLQLSAFRPAGGQAVELALRAGEVLALGGVDGNGQAALVDAVAGLAPATGRVSIDGQDVSRQGVAGRMRAGLAYIPADRSATSLMPPMSVAENLDLRRRRGLLLRPRARRAAAVRAMARYAIRAAGPDAPARSLSGGNQQKIVVAREVGRAPKVLVAYQATWGLDPGATRFVREQVLALRDAGGAVLYVSSELDEVLALGDRVGIMFAGRVTEPVPRAAVDLGRIGRQMAGGA